MNFMHFQGPNFTLQVPTDWFITSNTDFQAIFIAPPVERGPGSNFAIGVRNILEPTTVEVVSRVAREIQEANYPEYSLLDEQEIIVNGVQGFYRRYTWRNPAGMLILQQQVFFVFDDNTIYTLTATRPDNPDGQDAAQLDAAFGAMFESFNLAA